MDQPETPPVPESFRVSHAFLIDPRTGIVHLVNADTARAECSPSWAPPPAEWIGFDGGRQDRVCQACLALAEALRATGQLVTAGASLQPDRSDSVEELDAAALRARRAAAKKKGRWRGGA